MRLVLVSLSLGLLTTALPAQQFTVDGSALPANSLWTDGVEIVDVDGDDDLDILFANGNGYASGGASSGKRAQHLFLNDGSGSFSASHGDLNIANVNAKMVIAEDFDKDGDQDLMYAITGRYPNPDQRPRLLINQGGDQAGIEGEFADESVTRLPNVAMASFCVAAGDVDDDGDMDVVFTDGGTFGGDATQARLYLNDGSANFTNVTSTQMPADLYNAQDAVLFDYDGDDDIDITLSGKGGDGGTSSRLYLNDGSGNFTISSALNALGSGATYEIDWGDLDGDGDFDAAVQSITGQNEGWAENLGPTTTISENTLPSPNGQDDNEMACVDYDSDGDLDIFVASLGNTEKVYRNDGSGTWVNQQGQIENTADSTLDFGFGDLDGDDDYEMVTGNGEGTGFTNKVFENGGSPDILPPTFLDAADHSHPMLDPTTTVFHTHIQDAVHDDGHINATMTYTWTTDLSSGGGTADHMGGGLFRAEVPTAGAVEAGVTWTATDSAGNADTLTPAWSPVGFGTNGTNGLPELRGSGTAVGSSTNTLSLTNYRNSANAALFISVSSTPVAFKGGFLYTVPLLASLFVTTPGSGSFDIPFAYTAGLPSGFPIYWQFAIQDPAAIGGVAVSNATLSTSP